MSNSPSSCRPPLIAPASMPAAARAVDCGAPRARLPETPNWCVCLIAALVAVLSYVNLHSVDTCVLGGTDGPAGDGLTLAGWWTVLVSYPLFVFLLLRGLWRHFVWTKLMRKIAHLELRRRQPSGWQGGLAFLAEYPNVYMLFVFGISSVMAAAVTKHFLLANINQRLHDAGEWLADHRSGAFRLSAPPHFQCRSCA